VLTGASPTEDRTTVSHSLTTLLKSIKNECQGQNQLPGYKKYHSGNVNRTAIGLKLLEYPGCLGFTL